MYQRRKASGFVIIFLFLAVLYATYIVNNVIALNADFNHISYYITYLILHPVFYITKYTATLFLSGLCIWAVIVAFYISSIMQTMHGAEYGTAKFDTAKNYRQKYSSKDSEKNKIISENIQICLDDSETEFNANEITIGGSGSGKSFRKVIPNLLKANTSYVVLDPKGELLRKTGTYLKTKGYNIKVLNFVKFTQSDRYNPIAYLKSPEDISILVKNIMENTTPKKSAPSEPFWEDTTTMYFKFLFFLTWYEGKNKNIPELLDYMLMSEVNEDGSPSEMDIIVDKLEAMHGTDYEPVKYYRKVFVGAPDTVRSIILSANSRIDFMDTPEIRRILSDDDVNFAELGCGVNYDEKTKTALFLVLPSNDQTFNPVIGVAYTQLFQTLYYEGDFHYDGRLPIFIQFLMDEFANVPLPDNFTNIVATARSYGISLNIIIQNLAQIKKIFEKDWESITGNCDLFIYLGGNEQGSHEYVSKLLGKWTIDKRSHSRSFGVHGNNSRSDDVLGRELMTPDEVRRLPRKKCIVVMASNYPVIDDKCKTQKYKEFKQSKHMKKYVHHPTILKDENGDYILIPSPKRDYTLISVSSLDRYKNIAEENENVSVFEFNAADLITETFDEGNPITAERLNNLMSKYHSAIEKQEQEIIQHKLAKENKVHRLNSIMDIITTLDFSDEQLTEIQYAMASGLDDATIKDNLLKTELSAVRMHLITELLIQRQNI